MTETISIPETFAARVRGVPFEVAPRSLGDVGARKVFEYGLQRILNDACAGAKNDDEALSLAKKRWDNLVAGVVRASPIREGNPVRKRAMELATAAITRNAAFLAAIGKAGLKVTSKEAVAKAKELAEKKIAEPGNPFIAQAEADVAAAKGLVIEDLDIEV